MQDDNIIGLVGRAGGGRGGPGDLYRTDSVGSDYREAQEQITALDVVCSTSAGIANHIDSHGQLVPFEAMPAVRPDDANAGRLCPFCGYNFVMPEHRIYAPPPPVYIPPQRY